MDGFSLAIAIIAAAHVWMATRLIEEELGFRISEDRINLHPRPVPKHLYLPIIYAGGVAAWFTYMMGLVLYRHVFA